MRTTCWSATSPTRTPSPPPSTSFIAAAGGLDLVVANAGVATYGPFRDMDLATIERMTRVNWLGTVYTVHAALPHLLDRADGHILLVSSSAGHRSFPWAAVYGATKAAQRMFGEALRHELSGTGVSLTRSTRARSPRPSTTTSSTGSPTGTAAARRRPERASWPPA